MSTKFKTRTNKLLCSRETALKENNYDNTVLLTAIDCTWNCQLSVVGNIESFICYGGLDHYSLLQTLSEKQGNNLLLIDIDPDMYKSMFLPRLKNRIKVVLNKNFISTNTSVRKIVIFQLK